MIIAGWWALINLPVDVDPQTLMRNRDDGQLPPSPQRWPRHYEYRRFPTADTASSGRPHLDRLATAN